MGVLHPGRLAGAREAFAASLAGTRGSRIARRARAVAVVARDRDEAITLRREAYLAYQRRGDTRNAGRIATYLAAEERIAGQLAAAAGWLARARRLLAGHGPGAESGWLEVEEAKRPPTRPRWRYARGALAIAHGLGDHDIECVALAHLGRAVVSQGRIDEGVGYSTRR